MLGSRPHPPCLASSSSWQSSCTPSCPLASQGQCSVPGRERPEPHHARAKAVKKASLSPADIAVKRQEPGGGEGPPAALIYSGSSVCVPAGRRHPAGCLIGMGLTLPVHGNLVEE